MMMMMMLSLMIKIFSLILYGQYVGLLLWCPLNDVKCIVYMFLHVKVYGSYISNILHRFIWDMEPIARPLSWLIYIKEKWLYIR